MSAFEIRDLRDASELRECVRLQEETWGEDFSERVPEAILLIATRLGGVVAGAFLPDGSMAGFVFGLTGLERGRLVHWSDMLAVRPSVRGRGVGTALKLHQRRELLSRGVERMYWTFDPLEAGNAELNLGRLGAVGREYVPHMYGEATSPLHRGIGTDRYVVHWEMRSARVRSRIEGSDGPPAFGDVRELPRGLERLAAGGEDEPGQERTEMDAPALLVAIPAEIQALKHRAPQLAQRWREATRRVLGAYLARGWEARELLREGNLPHYLLVRSEAGTIPQPRRGEEADGLEL